MRYSTETIEFLTRQLRVGDDAFFRGLRAALIRHGVDPTRIALVEMFLDGEDEEFCVIVTPDDSLPISFGYAYPGGDHEHGRIIEWDDSEDPWADDGDLVERARTIGRMRF